MSIIEKSHSMHCKECGGNVAMVVVVEQSSGASSDRFDRVFSMFMKLGGSKKIHNPPTEEISAIQRLGEVI